MSADNWRICPKCHKNTVPLIKPEYGVVSEAEYLEAIKKEPEPEEENLREDWDIGIDEDGSFFVNYSCFCELCGFRFEFEQEVNVFKRSSPKAEEESDD